jgi:hypothetical protein
MLLLDKLIAQAGVPEGIVNLVNGYGHTAGAALTTHPDVDKIAFTGSTEVGKRIVEASAGNLVLRSPDRAHQRRSRHAAVSAGDLRLRGHNAAV